MTIALAETLYARAGSFAVSFIDLAAVAHLHAQKHDPNDARRAAFNGQYSPALYLLAGFTLELNLKAAIAACGGNEQELKRIGHNLHAAKDAAERRGFISSAPRISFMIEHLHAPHSEFHFRYGGPENIAVPDLEELGDCLEALTREVAQLVYA